jgi:hypothetical protein
MANGIPQLMTPSASTFGKSLSVLAQGLVEYYLATEQKWGIFYHKTGDPVSLGQKSSIIDQIKNGAGTTQLINNALIKNENRIDSVIALNVRKGAELSSYKTEAGSFATYNKIERPRIIPIRLVKSGTESDRQAFLLWLDYVVRTTDLFDIAVPEVTYTNLTLVDYSITRESRSGVTLIVAECVFQEIMEVTFEYKKSKTNNAQRAEDQPPKALSNIKTNDPSPGILAKLGL